MSKIRALWKMTRTACAAGALLLALGTAQGAWAQLPVTDITLPVPVGGGVPIFINVNPTSLPPTVQRPVQKPFTFFGLLPPTVSGVCAQITPSYMAVMDAPNSVRVFTYKQGYIPPADVVAGRPVKVTYKVLDNGLLQVTSMHVTGRDTTTVNGVPIPAHPTTGGPNVPSNPTGVPVINVKPVNGVITQ